MSEAHGSASRPSQEELQAMREPGFLWDPVRHRIVWANEPACHFFGCDNPSDLPGRPFDPAEPAVIALRDLALQARSGIATQLILDWPSADPPAGLIAQVSLSLLPDGRPGLVIRGEVLARDSGQSAPGGDPVFDALPDAALIVDRNGAIVQANLAAHDMLAFEARLSFGHLLGNEAEASGLLRRLGAVALVSVIRPVATRLGQRQVRLTLRRMNLKIGHILVILGDVKGAGAPAEVRVPQMVPEPGPAAASVPAPDDSGDVLPASDNQARTPAVAILTATVGELATVPGPQVQPDRVSPPHADYPKMTAEDARIFAELGRRLERESRPLPPPVSDEPLSAPQGVSPVVTPENPQVPPQGMEPATLDGETEPCLFVRDGILLHATPAALALLGVGSAAELREMPGLVQRLQTVQGAATVRRGQKPALHLVVEQTPFTWWGGSCTRLALRTGNNEFAQVTAGAVAPEPVLTSTPVAQHATQTDTVPGSSDAAAELRALLDTVADGIFTLDARGRIKSYSAGAEAILGYREAEVLDKALTSLLAPDSRKILREYLAAIDASGLKSILNDGREVLALEKNGGQVPLFITVSKMRTANAPAKFCAVVRDITQWKKTEQELRAARDEAEQTSRQKSEFLARISHELRTPLNAILGFSEVMRLERFGEIRNDRYRSYVSDIHTSGTHLLSLINDLLDLSKVEAGKLELNFTSVNLAEIVDQALRLMHEQAASARVLLRKSIPADLPHVVADLRSMNQILLNLISNAIKFTDPGGQVIVSANIAETGELVLRVKDTGIGMTEAQIAGALEPFGRVATDGRKSEGTGLGLPLSRALAEANRASFSLASEPRKGTTISIQFPGARILAG